MATRTTAPMMTPTMIAVLSLLPASAGAGVAGAAPGAGVLCSRSGRSMPEQVVERTRDAQSACACWCAMVGASVQVRSGGGVRSAA